MLLWPPRTGTQRSLVAPRSSALPSSYDWWAKPREGLRRVVCVSDSRTSHLTPLKKSYGGGDSNPVGGPGKLGLLSH
ncbi:unnamed protein product [Schistocephalus solidus]|uniref:Uncharacterized protein n=1 Tax=Schistocephalus solidus TaxID=70667 RepID=A0A183SAT6_SCHSO|nr:unnamed protein product [Schistocephalus solidus]